MSNSAARHFCMKIKCIHDLIQFKSSKWIRLEPNAFICVVLQTRKTTKTATTVQKYFEEENRRKGTESNLIFIITQFHEYQCNQTHTVNISLCRYLFLRFIADLLLLCCFCLFFFSATDTEVYDLLVCVFLIFDETDQHYLLVRQSFALQVSNKWCSLAKDSKFINNKYCVYILDTTWTTKFNTKWIHQFRRWSLE